MGNVIHLLLRTLISLVLTVVLFIPLYVYISVLWERYGEFDFQVLTYTEQFVSVALAITPFFVFTWIRKRLKLLHPKSLR